LNHVDIYFSIVQRKVVYPTFTDLAAIEARLTAFEHCYNTTAVPFGWKFTAPALQDLLARIDANERAAHQAAAGDPHELPAATTKC
jgi:hypothetical protein